MGYLDFGKTQRQERIIAKAMEESWDDERFLTEIVADLEAYGELGPNGLENWKKENLLKKLAEAKQNK